MCPHTRRECPFGMHACSVCGRVGHGAMECRFAAAQTQVVPPPVRPPVPPAAVVPTPTSSTETRPLPGPAEAKHHAVWVPGFGCKGEGKLANYGVVIPPPSLLPPAAVLPAPQQAASSSDLHEGLAHPAPPLIPTPIAATTEDVEEWISTTFRSLTNISTKNPPDIGASILWKGLKISRHGNPSDVVEYFNGKVRKVEVSAEDGELYLYVD